MFMFINIIQIKSIFFSVTKMLLLQGVLNGMCVLSEFMCMKHLPLGDASALIFSSPLPAMIFSKIFLGQSLRLYKALCGFVLYTGVMLVVKPTFLFGVEEKESFERYYHCIVRSFIYLYRPLIIKHKFSVC